MGNISDSMESTLMGAQDGQVVVFTGAGAGIGRPVVARYVAEGAWSWR
ncbi:hypothetical protein [Nocardia testacea]